MKKGCMIVCDGGNGAGKSTVLKVIEKHLQSKNYGYLMTREPGGTVIGEKIREVILNPNTPEMFEITELLLFAAARAQHVKEKIIPAIQEGKVVVSDRFDSATFSFQHFGRGLSFDLIKKINDIAIDGFKPNITIILDIDPLIGIQRVISRGSTLDRMEMADIAFLNKARNGYLAQAKADPQHFAVIDASQPLEIVTLNVLKVIDNIIS